MCQLLSGHHEVWQRCGPIKRSLQSNRANKKNNRSNKKKPRRIVLPNCDDTLIEASSSSSSYTQTNRAPNVKMKNANPPLIGPRISAKLLFLFLFLFLSLIQCLQPKWAQAQARPSQIIFPQQQQQVSQLDSQQQQQQQQVSSNKLPQPSAARASGKQEQIRQKLFNLNEADENGIYLLGLFDIHSRPSASSPFGGGRGGWPFGCGPIDVDAGETSSRRPMQNMWAFLWAIDQVNQDETLLPGVKLGSLVLDTCSSELQTSQQLANLLHGHHEGQLPRAGQFAGLVADQRDWRSVEASASIASSVGLTTFVTQTRSTKLNEQTTGDQTTKLGPNVAAAPPPMDNLDGLAPLVRSNRQMDERLLGGLLGIGNMMTSSSGDNVAFAGQQLQGQQLRDIYNANQQPQPTMDGANLAPVMPPDDGRQEELRMIKMLPGNEMIADALASLCDQMKWDLISVIYDSSEPDLVDLHDELIRELFLRNTQLALDEQLNGAAGGAATARLPSASSELPTSTAADQYERILLALARKAQIGSRVVVSLLGIQSARKIQAKLNEIRNGSGTRKSGSLDAATLKQLNSLQWITITDREPYYSYPTDSLGVISVSSSSSLMPEFKHYYDHLKLVEKLPQMTPASSSSSSLNTLNRTTRELNEQPTESTARFQPNNKWWPEYMKAVMTRRREQLGELLADECAKWLEPTLSPLNERCRQLDLASLADLERLRPPLRAGKFAGGSPAPIRLGPSGSFKATLAGSNRDGLTTPKSADGNKLTRYLASGWDHNGMDVINSVLAIANGLESIRQTLCSNVTFGLCPEMRQLVVSNEAAASSLNGILESESEQQQRRATQQPSLSELVHEELMKLTFQLVDGQMFRLNQSPYSAVAAISAAERAPNIRPAAVAAAAADGDDLTLGLLASGFLPLVQEHSPRSTQLDAKLKFYNLRFLRQNSIGFVKFAQFSQEDGLTWQANQSQALHYSSIPSNFTDQTPIKEVKSSCTDETRCLMLSAFVGSSQSGGGKSSLSASSPSSSSSSSSHLNEEQLAAGFNSLFKLDHPLISAASQNSNLEEPKLSTRSGGASADLARVRTMRSRAKFLSVPISDPFQATEPIENSTSTNRMQPPSQQQQQQTQRARRFEVIVLLPLHKSTAKINKTTSGGDNNNSNNNNNEDAQLRLVHSCGGSNSSGHYHHFRLDESRSFQQLAALAYAQQLVNGHLQLPKAANQQQHQQQSNRALTMTTTANLSSASSGQQPQQKQPQAGNELVISVIDYCGQIDLVEPSLLALLRSRQQAAKLEQHDDRSSQLVAVVDFDSRVGRLVDSALASANASTSLLHLTIGRQAMEASEQQRQSSPSHTSHDEQRPATTRTLSHEPSRRHLRISLLPSKTKEIEALLSLIKLFPSWRLVHLIYTDSYEFRDEFVRRANEAGICVSKLIWVPQVESTIDERGSSGDEVIDDGEEDLELSGRLGATLEKTRQLFKRELYDFSQQHNPSDRRPPLDGDDGETRASQRDYDGLNSTRLLVVLASSSDATNRLILEAASQSMLDDYVWLTTHEWLKSVELPFERAAAEASAAHKVAQALPKHFLSTKMESFEGHHFKEYFSHLLPALHEPIPADWFDEFWQQHFKCRLPTSTGGGRTIRDNRPEPLCNYSQRLDWDKMRDVDDLVPYTIRAIESLHVALSGYTDTTTTTDKKSELVRLKELSRDFRLAFDLGTREIVGNSAPAGPSRQDPVSQSLVGFHIVHRLQQPSSRDSQDQQQQASSPGGGSRRTNSRQLPANDSTGLGQLVRVGLWRDHYQLKHGFKLALAPFGKRRSKNGGDTENNNKQDRSMESSALRALLNDRGSVLSMLETISADDGAAKQTSNANPNKQLDESVAEQEMNSIARSLERLTGIKSRCSNSETCGLCKRQIGLTMSLIAQEEARLEQRELRPSEPRATSGNSVLFGGIAGDSSRRQRLSSLDGPTLSNFDDEDEEEAEEEGGDNRFGTSEVPGHLKSSRPAKWMQAKAERRLQSQSGSLDEIQAAASSLFDSRTSQQVASDTRRAYRHYANQHHAQYQSGGGGGFFWPEAASGLRRHSGALLSVLSLIGVAFMAATMTYFYPNMLDSQAGDRALAGMAAASNGPQWRRVKKFNQSQRSTSSSQCNIMLDEDEELNRIMGQMRPDSFLASIMANIADYLMLTSLMMLYSINVAYLLPAASVGVCWLRRVGLTLSYTLLFGSILAKIQEIHRRRQLLGCFDGSRELDYDSTKKQSKRASKKASAQSLEPVEENVEIGFESLTFDNNNELQTGVSHDSNAIDFEGKNHAQQSVVMEANGHQQQAQQEPVDGKLPDEPPGGSLKLPLLLLLANLAASLVWLVKQPPEPTLYQHTCWHCASLARSPVLFLYEPLLSLIGPGLILAISWIWSIVLFNRASASDAQFVRAMKRLIMNQPLSFTQMQNPEYLRLKQKQLELGEQLRDSKLLVITTTLLVLLWASATLSIVSASQELLRSITAATGSGLAPTVASTYRQQLGQHAGDEGQSLVYANILSGAIVFMVLFVYRLNWLFSCFIAKKARKFNYDQISSSTSLAGVGGVANSSRRRPFRLFKMRRGSKNFSQDHHQQQQQLQNQHQPGSFTDPSGQQMNDANKGANQERLKLQHFSMTYGTYHSAGGGSTSSDGLSGARGPLQASHQLKDTHLQTPPPSTGEAGASGIKTKSKSLTTGQQAKSTSDGSKSRSIFKLRKSTTSRGSASSTKGGQAQPTTGTNGSNVGVASKLQRRQSNGSVASSQAKLMRRFSDFDLTDDDDDDDEIDEFSISSQHQSDTISCAMSVGSNSTSQLQGNDLYPIDCSIQLESQPAGVTATPAGTTTAATTTTTIASTGSNGGQQDQRHKLATVEL